MTNRCNTCCRADSEVLVSTSNLASSNTSYECALVRSAAHAGGSTEARPLVASRPNSSLCEPLDFHRPRDAATRAPTPLRCHNNGSVDTRLDALSSRVGDTWQDSHPPELASDCQEASMRQHVELAGGNGGQSAR